MAGRNFEGASAEPKRRPKGCATRRSQRSGGARALRKRVEDLPRKLKRIGARGTVDERLREEGKRLECEFAALRGEVDASAINTEHLDILRMSRR